MGHIVLRLDRVMADRKMSLNELSERVGVANVNLSKMKNGHISAIRFSTLAAICDVLQCQPGDILEFAEDDRETEFTDNDTTYKVWLEDSASAECRLKLVEEKKLAGASFWKLGFETSDIWDTVTRYIH